MPKTDVKVRLLGDPVRGYPYVGWAKKKCSVLRDQARKLGIPCITKHFIPDEDVMVTIHADVRDFFSWVRIDASGCSLYMDHGMLQLGNIAPLSPTKASDGQLYIPGHLTDNLIWGDIKPSAFTQTSTTQQPFVDGAVPGCCKRPIAPPEEASTQPELDEAFWAYKYLLNTCPPSMYSGKLRLYVQALYGLKYDGKSPPWQAVSESGIPKVKVSTIPGEDISNITLSNIGGQSHGLYTDSEGNYWLLWIYSDSGYYRVRIYKMEQSACSASARTYLLSEEGQALSREERAVYESVILGTCRVDPNFTFTLNTNLPIFGAPVAYGWSFKWDGSQISMTTVKQSGIKATSKYESKRYTITLIRTAIDFGDDQRDPLVLEQIRWNINATYAGKGEWMTNFGFQNIWYPIYSDGVLGLFQDLDVDVPTFGSGEFYSFYDKNDNIIACEVSAESIPAEPGVFTPDPIWHYGDNRLYMNGASGKDTSVSYAAGSSGSISVNGVVVTSLNKGITNDTSVEWSAEAGSGGWNSGFVGGMPSASPSDPNYDVVMQIQAISGYTQAQEDLVAWNAEHSCFADMNYRNAGGRYTITSWNSGYGGWSERSAAVIPFFDCAGIYVGTNGQTFNLTRTGLRKQGPRAAVSSFQSRCGGGSPWYEYNLVTELGFNIADLIEVVTEVTVDHGLNKETYIGYGGTAESGRGCPNSVLAPVKANPYSADTHPTEVSAVAGSTSFIGSLIIGNYSIGSMGSGTFVGAA